MRELIHRKSYRYIKEKIVSRNEQKLCKIIRGHTDWQGQKGQRSSTESSIGATDSISEEVQMAIDPIGEIDT